MSHAKHQCLSLVNRCKEFVQSGAKAIVDSRKTAARCKNENNVYTSVKLMSNRACTHCRLVCTAEQAAAPSEKEQATALPSSKAGADTADADNINSSAMAHDGELPAVQQAQHSLDAESPR